MAQQLARIRGKFILSIIDNPEVRTLFKPFTLTPIKTTYTVASRASGKVAAELLISNFKLPQ